MTARKGCANCAEIEINDMCVKFVIGVCHGHLSLLFDMGICHGHMSWKFDIGICHGHLT